MFVYRPYVGCLYLLNLINNLINANTLQSPKAHTAITILTCLSPHWLHNQCVQPTHCTSFESNSEEPYMVSHLCDLKNHNSKSIHYNIFDLVSIHCNTRFCIPRMVKNMHQSINRINTHIKPNFGMDCKFFLFFMVLFLLI